MLFCDVRGSTAAAEELDAEAWTEVMNEVFELFIAPVERYEGTVARLMGDAILAFFGAPTAHEDDPQRAVMAGLEIVSAIGPFRDRLAGERGLDLDVRVGINTGSVVVGDVGSVARQEYTAMGDAVNVAARMEQTAAPGTVQITEDTYRLVADLFDVEPLGDVQLKGKRRPVSSYRVIGRRATAPWTVRAARRLEARLIGRGNEMSRLRSALDAVEDRRGWIVLLVGDPGLGKTRLVEEASALWSQANPDDDRRWGMWRCVPYDTMQPYAQYRRVIRERAGIAEGESPDAVRSKISDFMRHAPEGWRERSERVARALFGVELENEPKLQGEAFRRELTDLLVGSTRADVGRRLVVFEDLHWCDHASLELIRETVRLVDETPVVFLATLRPDPSAGSAELRRWVETELAERCTTIVLEPLTGGQSQALIGELLPVEGLPEDVSTRILERTEGNPLFVEEVARTLIERGVVTRSGDGWRLAGDAAEVAIPDTVQSLITAGLDRLPDTARRTVQAAAVIGRTFEDEILRGVVDADGRGGGDGQVDADLEVLERRDLIRPITGGPRSAHAFRHALTHEAAYGSLLVRNRRAVHRRVAEVLERANAGHADEVAPHLARHFAEAGDDDATLRYAAMAGDAAARLFAHAEAVTHYRAALDVARRLDADADLIGSLFVRRGTALEVAGRQADAIANYEEQRDEARSRRDERMELAANVALALLYSTASSVSDPARGLALSHENVATARRIGDRAAEGRALWNILVANVYGGHIETAIEAGDAALAIARELGDPEPIAFTLTDVSRARLSHGDLAIAERLLEEARELWERLDNRPMLGDALAVSSLMRLMQGDRDGAVELARTALANSEAIDNAWGQSHALMGLYQAQLLAGEMGPAMASIRRSMELGDRGGFAYAGVATRSELAAAYVALGDPDGAVAEAERALEVASETVYPALSVAQGALAEALLAAGDHERAAAVLAETVVGVMPEPDQSFAVARVGLARSRLALVRNDPAAAAAAASDVLEHLRAHATETFAAKPMVALARARIAQGREAEAASVLDDAIATAGSLGARMSLWEALALRARLLDERDADEAGRLRRRAKTLVEEIATGVDDDDLRARFRARAAATLDDSNGGG
jgi:class 3 adenylate cyclase